MALGDGESQVPEGFHSGDGVIKDGAPTPTSNEHNEHSVAIESDICQIDYDEDNEENGDSIQHRLASLFLRMQIILHVSKTATQGIVNELYEIGVLAGEFSSQSIENVLRIYYPNIDNSVLALLTDTLQERNPLYLLSNTGPFATDHKRSLYFRDNLPVIEPVEYNLDSGDKKKTSVYVPILNVLSELLNRNDILDKVLAEPLQSEFGHFKSYRDGSFFKENPLLSREELSFAFRLYIDDFKICNPLGTSRKKA